ncbi:hypothetical protein CGRA01v4_12135 [Colletotrichum graminicola]|uniref:Uncharacterized protein n=1 Tax=Colletotrichum graminicola (strain M1.001 / M2 / FGSC 10212) TaxID=645133 RepID=E3QT87_COLGM|nr:uncharacterized protein GLRG_09219 [Colletotrichum graminicola M1.001]EFQ34075.1 hypothetical protein GLRG_09219 [Colletotrichum graminicola M1.001]WDK20846.1 hypothetical protein CGRA01v4_12135 [Colletotrichum graminicola]
MAELGTSPGPGPTTDPDPNTASDADTVTDTDTDTDTAATAVSDQSNSCNAADDFRLPGPDDAMADFIQTPAARPNDGSRIQCCCGRTDCVYLSHSRSVLETVEKDVHTAAKLGKALLARHEAYMADAERDRMSLTTRIEQLESEKVELQAENARTVEENRSLLDQLEMLNTTVQDADIRIQTLEATLLSSHQAVRRLEGAAARAAEMERHIALLEQEQLRLQNTLITTESEARSAMQRWRKAERGISDLQEQLERMEKEAKEERERHVEVLSRMERQREMEKELNTAAGRLKGAAAAKSLTSDKPASSVVSHFVRDLLQDNANLQLGIAELREMLINSNDEIQAMRDQLMCHQPIGDEDAGAGAPSTLRAEIGPDPREMAQHISQELHIHHHYHVAEKTKPRKKRHSLNPAVFPPASVSRSSTPPPAAWRPAPSPMTPLAASHSHNGSTSTISMPSNRWSVFSEQPSEFALSSVPSSPQSNPRHSMFDRPVFETDMPMSPTTSLDPTSPTCKLSHRNRPSEASIRSFSVPPKLLSVASPAPPVAPTLHVAQHISSTIEEEREENGPEEAPDLLPTNDDHIETETETETETEVSFSKYEELPPRRLHRAVSHESIISLSGGLDIHTLKVRPSQLTFRPLGGAEAVFTGVTARSTISRGSDKRSDVLLRDSLAGRPVSRMVSTPIRSASPGSTHSQYSQNSSGLGRWVSWRPWTGGGSAASASRATTPTAAQGAGKEKDKDVVRAPGINQPGAIPGFQEYLAAHQRRGPPSKVLPDVIDVDALRDGLEGGL